MKVSELEELGFIKFHHGLELNLNNGISLEIWEDENFITINEKYQELKKVNTIEKVKLLIELLK